MSEENMKFPKKRAVSVINGLTCYFSGVCPSFFLSPQCKYH